MEARAPFTGTPSPQVFGHAEVVRYVLGAVVQNIILTPRGGECVYTRKLHEVVCYRLCGDTTGTPQLEQRMKREIEQLNLLVPNNITCEILKNNPIDLLHVKWDPAPHLRVQPSSNEDAGALSPIPQHPAWNRDD